MLSPEQQILVTTYGGGDYAHLEFPEHAELVDDTLFLFLMRELAPDGDTSREEYVWRMERAIEDIESILVELQK